MIQEEDNAGTKQKRTCAGLYYHRCVRLQANRGGLLEPQLRAILLRKLGECQVRRSNLCGGDTVE